MVHAWFLIAMHALMRSQACAYKGLNMLCVCAWLQLRVLDFMALSLGMVASLRPAAQQLQPKRPPQDLMSVKNCVLVLETLLVSAVSEVAVLVLLTHQPWFHGGTGQNEWVSIAALVLTTTASHLACIAMKFAHFSTPPTVCCIMLLLCLAWHGIWANARCLIRDSIQANVCPA